MKACCCVTWSGSHPCVHISKDCLAMWPKHLGLRCRWSWAWKHKSNFNRRSYVYEYFYWWLSNVVSIPKNIEETPLIVIDRQWLGVDNPRVDWHTNCMHTVRSDRSKYVLRPHGCLGHPGAVQTKTISFRKMCRTVKKDACELFAVRVRSNIRDINISDQFSDIVEEFNDIFLNELPDHLPRWGEVNLDIKLKSDQPVSVCHVIWLFPKELKELKRQLQVLLHNKRQLQVLLHKGRICPSSSPYGAPLFVKKKSGELRMVCDYRAVNRITIHDANPLPHINEALDQVSWATMFS